MRRLSALLLALSCTVLAQPAEAGPAVSAGVASAAPAAAAPASATAYRDRLPAEEFIYFLLPDRFENGDKTNDLGGLKGDRLATGYDPTSKGFFLSLIHI